MIQTRYLSLNSHGNCAVLDITSNIQDLVTEMSIKNGLVTIFCPSSTSALTTIEYESGCIRDLQTFFDKIIDPTEEYFHNFRWGDGNGHSHLRAALLQADLTVPVVNGGLTLGTWQQIIFVDFDNHPRSRRLVVQGIGD